MNSDVSHHSPNALNSPENSNRMAQIVHNLGDLAMRVSVNAAAGLVTLGVAEAVTDVPTPASRAFMAALGTSAYISHRRSRQN